MVGGHSQSAASKQLDFTITQEVLRAYGDAVKHTIKSVVTAVSDARQDGLLVSVSGLDELDIGDFGTELQEATNLLQLGIASPTLKRQIFQKLAFKYLSDIRQETKDQIAREIDSQVTS
jgi:predicted membrane GTPase involved in stress response